MLTKYIGDRRFYRNAMAVAVPIMIQNFITNFVSLLDNLMVGRVGTAQMSGVAIVNQVLFVVNLCVFGAVSGAGIFTAQYAGSGDREGVRATFRFKLITILVIAAAGIGVLLGFGDGLIRLWLRGEGSPREAERFLEYGRQYLAVMLWGIPPFAVSNVYCSTLRENGETVVPMAAGVIAVAVNLFFNYALIFGHFGAPAMGVRGAAWATVISRYVELALAAGWTHTHPGKMPFVRGLYRTLRVPGALAGQILRKGTPLLLNEALWAAGMAVLNQCYSVRSLDVVSAINIESTIWNAMSVAFMATGNAVGILIGQKLGQGVDHELVMDEFRKLTAFSVFLNVLTALLMVGVSPFFPRLYATTEAVRALASRFIRVQAVILPLYAFTNCCYFAMRSGGKTVITFLFDSVFVWCVNVPLAYCLSRFTAVPVVPMYFLVQATEAVKCVIGSVFIKKRAWMQTIVRSPAGEGTGPELRDARP